MLAKQARVALFLLAAGAAFGQVPAIAPGGVVNGADYSRDLAPGAIITIFGSNLASGTAGAPSFPLPTSLGGTSVEVAAGGPFATIPLLYAAPGQINAQLPYSLAPGAIQVRVRTAAGTSAAEAGTLVARAPKLFTTNFSGTGRAVATNPQFSVLTDGNPAKPADTIILFLNSMGATDITVPAGTAAPGAEPGSTLARISDTVRVTINGVEGEVTFAGLAPNFAGLYQVNVRVPFTVLTGPTAVSVAIGTARSQASVNVPFRQLGFYYTMLGGKPLAGQTLNAQQGAGSSVALRHSDAIAWGANGFNQWTRDTGLGAAYANAAGIAMTFRNGSTTVLDNNGIEDRSMGNFYDNRGGGANDQKPGLTNLFSMSNYFPLVFATHFRLTAPVTVTEMIGYFDGDGEPSLPFDPRNPYVAYRMNVWTGGGFNPAPQNTGNFVGNAFSTDTTPGTFTISNTGVSRISNSGLAEPIFRVSFRPNAPVTLPPGEYWFSHDSSVLATPSGPRATFTMSLPEFGELISSLSYLKAPSQKLSLMGMELDYQNSFELPEAVEVRPMAIETH